MNGMEQALAAREARGRTAPATVEQLMVRDVRTCSAGDPLSVPAQIMWDHDCGCVPVVTDDGRLAGMVTDRDVCMAAYTQGAPLSQIQVSMAMARTVYAVKAGDALETAERLMQSRQVRRLPVVDDDGRLQGILSLSDIVRETQRQKALRARSVTPDRLVTTLAAICQPRAPSALSPPRP